MNDAHERAAASGPALLTDAEMAAVGGGLVIGGAGPCGWPSREPRTRTDPLAPPGGVLP